MGMSLLGFPTGKKRGVKRYARWPREKAIRKEHRQKKVDLREGAMIGKSASAET